MEPATRKIDPYFDKVRRQAHREGGSYTMDMSEDDWAAMAYHWSSGTKVYHSYADYCDD